MQLEGEPLCEPFFNGLLIGALPVGKVRPNARRVKRHDLAQDLLAESVWAR